MSRLEVLHEHANKISCGLNSALSVTELWATDPTWLYRLQGRLLRYASSIKGDCNRIIHICDEKTSEDRTWGYIDDDYRTTINQLFKHAETVLEHVQLFQVDVEFLAQNSTSNSMEDRQGVAEAIKNDVLRRAERMRNLALKLLATADLMRDADGIWLGHIPNNVDFDDLSSHDEA